METPLNSLVMISLEKLYVTFVGGIRDGRISLYDEPLKGVQSRGSEKALEPATKYSPLQGVSFGTGLETDMYSQKVKFQV